MTDGKDGKDGKKIPSTAERGMNVTPEKETSHRVVEPNPRPYAAGAGTAGVGAGGPLVTGESEASGPAVVGETEEDERGDAQ